MMIVFSSGQRHGLRLGAVSSFFGLGATDSRAISDAKLTEEEADPVDEKQEAAKERDENGSKMTHVKSVPFTMGFSYLVSAGSI